MHNFEDVNILTFNSHQTFNFNFARIGGRLFIIDKIQGKNISRWDPYIRPLPVNAVCISLGQGEDLYRQKKIDLVVCHNMSDLMEVQKWHIKKILCLHDTVQGRILSERSAIKYEDWIQMVRLYLNMIKDLHIVFVSNKKARSWNLEGTIIKLGIDPDEYKGYSGTMAIPLTVSNRFKLRGNILGYQIHKKIIGNLDCEIIGYNPELSGSKPAKNWEALKKKYREHRVYLFTALDAYEDGYNTAMLEAMATGMPVISYINNSSPIINGINGFISKDTDYLQRCLRKLLQNKEKAVLLGRAARKTAMEKFGIDQFILKWQNLIKNII